MNPANADAPSTGRKYWRSLSELEGNPEFEDYLRREFPVSGDQFPDNLSRRRWLQLMGASLTLAGAVGCRYEKEIIAPFAQRPKNRIPGKPQKFATTIEYAGAARPLLMTCFDGRPIKPEGNPDHPESLGATDLYSQAACLELFDPDRARTGYEIIDGRAEELDEDETRRRAKTFFSALRGGQAGTTVVLTETTSSPTLARLMGELAGSNVEWVQYSPVTDDNERAGLKQVFGADLVARPLLDRAQIILTLDRDFIAAYEGATVKLQRDFIAGRNADERRMNRLYSVESQLSITGMKADHRLAIRSSLIGSFLGQLFGEVQRLKSEGFEGYAEGLVEREGASLERPALFLAALAEDLAANQGAAVVLVGKNQPPEVHALAARLNDLIGATGATLEYRPAPNPRPVCVEAIAQLADRLNAGDVENLVVIGGNPAFDAPSDVDFGAAMERAGNVVRLGMWVDETSLRSDLHLPALHPFETWGDVISEYGVWSISQPMIAPLHFGWSAIEFAGEALGADANGQPADAQALVRETARGAVGVAGEIAWRGIVRDGFVRDSAAAAESASPTGEAELTGALDPTLWEEDSRVVNDSIELSFIPSRTLYDGRFGNNGWLQEFPDPVSKVTWDNVLYVNWATANALGLKQGVLARIGVSGSEIVAPVFIQPGQADGSVAIALGYGRKSAGKIGGSLVEGIDPVGHDVAPVRRSDAWWFATDVKVANDGTNYLIATTQDHNAIDTFGLEEISRRAPELVREGNFVDYVKFLGEGHSGAETHGEAEAEGGDSPTAPLDEKAASAQPHADEHDHELEGEDHAHDQEHAEGHHRQFPPQKGHHPKLESLWTEWSYEGQAWGMAIDLNRCTGCNACAVACQAENNVPIVGKDQVARNREMHWMRIDRYFSGDPTNPTALHQPMLCQQCENAPCESVCPVAATVHSTEGLNDMVYNRCIGTRYCGNNCPYKVRRFNYLWYRGNPRLNQDDGDLSNLVLNPEVTVRTRGVMEKCTFCVQRIQNAKIEAKAADRPLGANEIKTACQQACPTEAIVFGDLNREDSLAAQRHLSPRAYALLEELNVKPRNRYLARIRNPHAALHKFEVDKGLVSA